MVAGTEVTHGSHRRASQPRHALPARRHSLRDPLIAGAAVAVLALALRLFAIRTSFNIFIDEATYADIVRSVGVGTGVLLHGEPFILHPPLSFLILGTFLGDPGAVPLSDVVFALRPAIAVFGALVVFLITALLWKAGLPRVALAVGAVLALDSFVISFDSRVMLEAIAQFFAAATVVAAVMATRPSQRHVWQWSVATGLAGAATFATKETFGLVISLTLLIAAITAARSIRGRLLLALGFTALGYGLANLFVIQGVGAGEWWESRTMGLARLLGTYQSTGFNAADSQVSLWSRLGPNAAEYGLTYVFLAVGGLSGAFLLLMCIRRSPRLEEIGQVHRTTILIVSAWSVAACLYLAYAVLFGSLEEQMFYIAVAPCVTALVLLADVLADRSRRQIYTASAVLAAVLAAQVAVWAYVHSTPDNSHDTLLTWLPANVPLDSRIAVTEETSQFLIEGHQLGEWDSLAELRAERVDYVLLSPTLVEQGYALATPEFAAQVQGNGELVFAADGRRSDLELYDVRELTGGSR